MKSLLDPDRLLGDGLSAIRQQFSVPAGFPDEVEQAAQAAAQRVPSDHVDRTNWPFVTLDPASATDLDQAFAIEAAGADWLLHYAIADVAWFVDDGDAVDTAAWARGVTTYLPDGKASLYPRVLSEGAASLLPGGERPATILTVRIAPDGAARLDAVERARIRSRAKLAYETVAPDDLPVGFTDIAARIGAAEQARGAARVDPPEQEVEREDSGHYQLRFRPYSVAETQNAALSLAANMAVADALLAARTGLFRVMAGPDARAVARLRRTAQAFGLHWPPDMPLDSFEKTLDPHQPAQAAFMLAIRRSSSGASYVPYQAGVVPWHSAMAATYAHASAPLRRLADRYVLRAVAAVANGQAVPDAVTAAFDRLPAVMGKAEQRAAQIDRAVIDLAEVAVLSGQEGQSFDAVVTDVDANGARIQLCRYPVVARLGAAAATGAAAVVPGAAVQVRLDAADLARRSLAFSRVGGGAMDAGKAGSGDTI
jgi:exoribonuclease R